MVKRRKRIHIPVLTQLITRENFGVRISYLCHTTQSVLRPVHSLPPNPVLHRERSSASSFSLQYPLVSSRSPSSWLLLLPPLPVTYILSSIFPSISCFRPSFYARCYQFYQHSCVFITCNIILFFLTINNISLFFSRSAQLTSSLLQNHNSKLSNYL